TLVAVGAGRAGGQAERRNGGTAVGGQEETVAGADTTDAPDQSPRAVAALPPYRPTAG
ncbi:MAG: hypothetical protein QOH59_998, partial [Gemmatimonadales bacterium]|nr:hypothetical protein [Gemmatimonadales bacterium]